MNLTGIWTWIKSNMLLALGIAVGVLLLFFPKVLKGIFGTTRRVRHRRNVRRAIGVTVTGRHRMPRRRPVTRRRITRRKGAKKPWQIKGSLAARRHMAQIRRRR